MAQKPQSILLTDTEADFVRVSDFCFQSMLDYMEAEVAGHRGVAMFGSTGLMLQYCADQGIILSVYRLMNPMGEAPSSGSSGSSSPSWHPPSANESASVSSEGDVSR